MRIMMILLLIATFGKADSYLLNGGQRSTIDYEMVQKIYPDPGTKSVTITFVEPQNFASPTYNQLITDFRIIPSRETTSIEKTADERGNPVLRYEWKAPLQPFDLKVSFRAVNHVKLEQINTAAPFPYMHVPADVTPYLVSTELVPSDNPLFMAKSKELTAGAKGAFDAVQKILTWVMDHMNYVLVPPEYGAIYAYRTGKGNCQNYSHLAAALMRASGIPTRIVNGVTLKEPYEIMLGEQSLQLNMAQGRHSWIEVWFPDLGWVPFDPQQTQLFVSNRFIRIETGIDNEDTMDDGLIRWTRSRGSTAKVTFEEIIDGRFLSDDFKLNAEKKRYGPRKILLTPVVTSGFEPVEMESKPEPEPEPEISTAEPSGTFTRPFIMGNLEYPEGVNFIFTRETHESETGSMELRKNFLVETAEYVTSKYQYAQTFILDKTINLHEIGLVMHKFGGSGRLWLELREDVNGAPAREVAVKSKPVDLNRLSSKPGYEWVDFSFRDEKLVLTPDRYWVSLAFSGSPIVNWFYSYGKPVGPVDGTRFRPFSEPEFLQVLGYEFNYRVKGLSR